MNYVKPEIIENEIEEVVGESSGTGLGVIIGVGAVAVILIVVG